MYACLHRQLGNHLGDDIVQVGAMRHEGQLRLVFAAQPAPVEAMHVFDIEVVAVAAPDLGENFAPFQRRYARRHQARHGNALGFVALADLDVFEFLGAQLCEHVLAVRRGRP
jgi:hypothetical protein